MTRDNASAGPHDGRLCRSEGEARLPDGYRVRVRPEVRVFGGGRVLVGGSPPSILRLSPAAAAVVPAPGAVLTVTDAVSARVAVSLLSANLADPVLPMRGAHPVLPTRGAHPVLPSPGDLAEVTVVIPTFDSPVPLDRALAAVAHPGLRVIVVDDASTDPTATAAVAARHGARLLRHPVNRGPAAARNTGLAAVDTPLVAFVDADVQLEPSALGRLVAHFADPGLAVVGPRLRGRLLSARPRWFEAYDAAHTSLDRGTDSAQLRAGATVAWLPSACLVGRRSALGAGFVEDLRVGEDVDLIWRLLAAGERVRYDPSVEAWHDTRTSARGWLARKVAYGRSSVPLTLRHSDRISVAAFSGPQLLTAAALLLPGWWTPPAVGLATALTQRRIVRALPAEAGARACAWRLAGRATWVSATQTADLLLRHWWPVTAVALGSPRIRRAALAALVIDLVRRRPAPGESLPGFLAGARLEDLAYGWGLWSASVRARSIRALLPRVRLRTASR